MRPLHRLTFAALLTAALTLPGAGPAAGHDRDTRDTREVRETREVRDEDRDRDARHDAERERRDAERQEADRDDAKHDTASARESDTEKTSSATATTSGGDLAAKSSGSSGTSNTSGTSSSGSNVSGSSTSGSSTSGSNTSGSNSGSSDSSGTSSSGSGSGSSGSGSSDSGSSGSDISDSGSNSGSGSSGSSDTDSDSGSSNSGSDGDSDDSDDSDDDSSNSGSDEDDDDGDGDDSGDDDESQVASAGDARRIDVETDPQGRERRRGEFLVRGGREVAEALRGAGFRTLSSRHLSNLNASVVRVEVRAGSTMDADIAFARRIAGTDDAEPNYVFRLSGGVSTHAASVTAAAQAAPIESGARVGVVDTGADGRAPALRDRIAATRGFGGPYTARAHGTYVAQILARENVRVEVADVFQADAQGAPVATAESIARGIDWLATRRIPVVNVSITGPDSGVLSAVVARAIERGTIVVAAAGNDGPAAPPVYPAAFANVVGVTAVDEGGRVYRRANRGQHVDFAALGVRVPVASPNGGVEYVSGTSYAAPLIAAAFAHRYTQQRPGGAVVEIARMQEAATDLGERGRDPIFGWGRVSANGARR